MSVYLHAAEQGVHRVDTVLPEQGGPVTVRAGHSVRPRSTALTTVNTWPMTTSTRIAELPFISCRTPDDPDVGCTAEVTWRNGWEGYWQRRVKVSTPSPTPVRWQLVVNLSSPDNPVRPTNFLTHHYGLTGPSDPSAGCANEPRIAVARGAGDYTTISATTPGEVLLQGSGRVEQAAPDHSILLSCP